jgi:hypothetical protein
MRTHSLFARRPAPAPAARRTQPRISLALPGVVAIAAIVVSLCTAGCGYTGNEAAKLTASSTQVSFGNVAVGASTSELVTLTATGTDNVVINGLTAIGKGFSTSTKSGVTLTPNQSLTVSVSFEPTAAGTDTGKLSIASNGSPMEIALSGTGVSASQHSVALSWQATPAVIGYYVYRGSQVSNLSKVTALDPNTSYQDTSVTNGQTYVYSVTSVNASYVESPQSSPVTVTIPN